MKRFLLLGIIIFIIPFVFSDDFKDTFEKFKKNIEDLNKIVDSSTINFTNYDKWYKEFKSEIDNFKLSLAIYKDKEFFKVLSEAIDSFSLAWNFLKQANDAFSEYTYFITGPDAGYAHKWKQTHNLKLNQGKEAIKEAIDKFNKAYNLFLEGK